MDYKNNAKNIVNKLVRNDICPICNNEIKNCKCYEGMCDK